MTQITVPDEKTTSNNTEQINYRNVVYNHFSQIKRQPTKLQQQQYYIDRYIHRHWLHACSQVKRSAEIDMNRKGRPVVGHRRNSNSDLSGP